jgi:tungstate transport system substrate-binding protein
MRLLTCALFAASVTLVACSHGSEPSGLTLGTTTSVGHSGLLDALLPLFEQASGVEVRPLLVGSGRALQMLVNGDADVAITHAPDAEAATLAGRTGWVYRKIMFNQFVIVGPRDDPAHAKGAPGAVDAMRRIAQSDATFVSRGDSSGTHERERQLWALAGAQPPSGRLVVAGSGMGTTLRVTDNVGAYTLTDQATFGQLAPQLRIALLFEGDPKLLNTYAVIVPGDGSPAGADARRFALWLAEGDGRAAIDSFRVGPTQVQAFFVWPAGAPNDRPDALPK